MPRISRRKPRKYGRKTGRRLATRRMGKGPTVATLNSSKRMWSTNRPTRMSALTGFPRQITVTLPYTRNDRINPGVVTGADTVFSLNSAFDPEVSGGGHQPRGFDQWAAIYKTYRVGSVTAVINVRQRASHGINCMLIFNDDPTDLGTTSDLLEQPNVQYLGINSSNTYPLKRRVKGFPHKALGMSWQQYVGNEDTAGLVTGIPTNQAYMHLVVQQLDNATAVDFEYEIVLFYRVTFFEQVNIPAS